MAGGPGGTGDGIQSESLAWAIIMSAFAGTLSRCCLANSLIPFPTQRSVASYLGLLIHTVFTPLTTLIISGKIIGMIQEQLEESLPWEIG